MSKSKIKTIVMVVAIVLCLALAGGWIAQAVVTNKKNSNNVDESAVFTVTTQNKSSSKMKLTAQAYTDSPEVVTYGNESYILTAETSHYSGNIRWTIAWTGSEIYWNGSEKTTSASDCVKLTEIDNRSVRVQCLQPFGQQIQITAALADKTSVTDKCVCDYKQTFELDELQIGFNTFHNDGRLNRGLISADFGIVPASVNLSGSQSLNYSCTITSSSYTKKSTDAATCAGLSFSIAPNMEVIERFGLDKYSFVTYTANFDNALTGTIDDFFDTSWGQQAISGTDSSLIQFAEDLCSSSNEAGYAVDSENLYMLTISGLPEGDGSVSFGYKVDLYKLIQTLGDMASLSLNNSNITFGG